MAIYEGVYAYLFKKNYASDDISVGEGIYTLTENCGSAEVRELQTAFRAHGDFRLDKIDIRDGLKQSGDASPDYSLTAYSYTPADGNLKTMLSRVTLRKSIKDVVLRGTKELIHAVITDTLPRGVYAVDCTYDRLFDEYTDIPVSGSSADDFEEERPRELSAIDINRFTGEPISAYEISGLGSNTFKKLAAVVSAIIAAKREGKTLYIVHNPEENGFVRSVLRAALKVLPVNLANTVSFVTASGTEAPMRDIVCVPTCDDQTIAALKHSGYTLELHEGGVVPADVPTGVFGEFFARASEDDVQSFLNCAPAYYEYVRRFDDLDVIMRLFLNKRFTSEEERSGQRTDLFGASVRLINDNFNLISGIRGELTEQITGLSESVDMFIGEFDSVSPDEVMNTVLIPLAELYKKCSAAGVSVASDIMHYIAQILFGYGGQSSAAEQKHFRLLMSFSRLTHALGEYASDLIEQMQSDVSFMRDFFTDYFTDGDYTEAAARIAYDILKILLKDVQSRYGDRAALRDMLIEKYSDSADERKMTDLLALVFGGGTDLYSAFDFVRDVIFADKTDAARHNARLNSYGAFLLDERLLEPAVKYHCEAISGGGHAEDARVVLSVLLQKFLSRSDGSLDGIYARFSKLARLIDDMRATQGLKVWLYDDFATRIINPDYKRAIAAVDADKLTENQIKYCESLINEFGEGTLSAAVESSFAVELRSLINRHKSFVAQSEFEGKLIGTRVDFIVRELLLLDGKTVFKLLGEYAPKELCEKVYDENGLGRLAPYRKSEAFISAAERIAREYLTSPEKTEGNDGEFSLRAVRGKKNKDAFIAEVKRVRDNRNVDFRIHLADASRRLFESILVSGVMFILAALAGVALYQYYEGGYFMSVYFAFPIIAALAGQLLYWYNVKENKTRSPLIMAAWQSLAVTAVLLGGYVLARMLLTVIY